MRQQNAILIEGNVTQEPEVTAMASGTKVCRFNIACNDEHEASFFTVSVKGELAALLGLSLTRGCAVRVTGRLYQERWETPEGEKRSKVVIRAHEVGIGVKA